MHTHARPVDRRSEILRHACVLFARQGYGGTTVRQIAEAAQLLSGSLYHHFPSKEAILLDILEDYFAETSVRNRTALDGATDAVSALRGLIRASLTVIARNPAAAVVVVGECRRLALTERYRWLADRTAQNNVVWRKVVAEGVRSGQLRSDLETGTIGYFVQTSVWAMAQWYREGGRYDPDEASELLIDLFVHGIAEPRAYRRRDLRELLDDAAAVQWPVGVFAALDALPGRAARSADGDRDPRARIGRAAGLLFARQGYAVTTTRQIAELAGVPVGSLAHHIGSKERLLTDMLSGFFEDLLAAFERDEAADAGPGGRVGSLVARTVEGLAEHGVASVLLLNEATADDGPKAELTRLLGDVECVWTRVLTGGMRDGELRAGLDAAFVQRVVRTAISTSSVAYPGMEVRHLIALYQEVLLGGIGAR